MGLGRALAVGLVGLEGHLVEVEADVAAGRHPDRPFVLFVQHTLFDQEARQKQARLDTGEGMKLTLRFRSASTALELESAWWARPGAGPIRHAMTMRNPSARPVEIGAQASLALHLAAPVADYLWAWHFGDEGGGGRF